MMPHEKRGGGLGPRLLAQIGILVGFVVGWALTPAAVLSGALDASADVSRPGSAGSAGSAGAMIAGVDSPAVGAAAVSAAWRWMLGLGGVPPALLLMVLGWLPESPRYLVAAGKEQEAARVSALRVRARARVSVGGWTRMFVYLCCEGSLSPSSLCALPLIGVRSARLSRPFASSVPPHRVHQVCRCSASPFRPLLMLCNALPTPSPFARPGSRAHLQRD